MTEPTPQHPPTVILPATWRFCQGLAKFGLTPAQCLTGVGRKYNTALLRIKDQQEVPPRG